MRKKSYEPQSMYKAVCGHKVDILKQSTLELCPDCVKAIPPLRDDQVGLTASAIARMRRDRRLRKSRARAGFRGV